MCVSVTNHRRAVAQPCVNGDRLSKGRMAKFDPAQIRNPWTDRHKIWNRSLRPRDDPPCKISCFSANGWNITKIFLRYNIPFLLTDLQVRPIGGFSRTMAQTTRSHARVKPFREPKFEVNIQPPKYPPKSKIWLKNGLDIFRPKTLLYKNFTYKRPLIVIVGP